MKWKSVGDEVTEYLWTWENVESKEELEMNGNDGMEWNERIGMEMEKSECDRSGWEEEWDGNGCKWMNKEQECVWEWKAGMCGDEGEGGGIGWKRGWNNE